MRWIKDNMTRLGIRWSAFSLLVIALCLGLALRRTEAQAPSVGSSTGSGPETPKTGEAAKGVAEETFTVTTEALESRILINGELKAARARDILAPRVRSGFGATVTYLALEGSEVKEGDRLLEFDNTALLSTKSEAERRLDEAKLRIQKTSADLEATHCDLLNQVAQAEGSLKIAKLYAEIPKELQPANTYEKYQLDFEKAKLALSKAKEMLANHEASMPANLRLAQIDKEQAEIDLKRIDGDIELLQIVAPQNGVVVYGDNWANNRKVQVGDMLFDGMPAISLPDLSTMQAIGFVYDTEMRYLSPGMRCELHLDTAPGHVWRGRIESLTSVASRKGFASQHKVFRAVVQPDTIDLSLMKPGMTVRIEAPVSFGSNVVSIPRDYLGLDVRARYFVRKGSNAKEAATQFVKVGAFNARRVQIVDGLKSGDKILKPR
jgi:HlyD family secretion protein